MRTSPAETSAVNTFDYRDLNLYLLFATSQLYPDEEHLPIFQELAKKAQSGQKIPLRDAKNLGAKEVLVTLPDTSDIPHAVEALGGGVHRIVVVKEGTDHVLGILSQLRLVRFFWEQGRNFPVIDQLYPMEIRELGIGGHHLVFIK